MPDKEPVQVAAGDAQPLSQSIDRGCLAVEGAFLDDQTRRTLDGCQGAFPGRTEGSRLGATAQARTEPSGFGCRSTRQEIHVAAKRQPYRADATAIDPSCPDADKESAIERRIAREPGALERRLFTRVHGQHIPQASRAGEDEVRFRPDCRPR